MTPLPSWSNSGNMSSMRLFLIADSGKPFSMARLVTLSSSPTRCSASPNLRLSRPPLFLDTSLNSPNRFWTSLSVKCEALPSRSKSSCVGATALNDFDCLSPIRLVEQCSREQQLQEHPRQNGVPH